MGPGRIMRFRRKRKCNRQDRQPEDMAPEGRLQYRSNLYEREDEEPEPKRT